MKRKEGNFWNQEILPNEITFRTSTKRTSFFPTKLYILQDKESNEYMACLDTNISTLSFGTIKDLINYIRNHGFDREDFGSSFDGRTPTEYEYHLKKGSKVMEYYNIINEIELSNPLDALKNYYPEEFI